MGDMNPILQARTDLLADIRRKLELAVAELDRGEGVELEVIVERLRHKFKSYKEGA
jgi:hypothetical protein